MLLRHRKVSCDPNRGAIFKRMGSPERAECGLEDQDEFDDASDVSKMFVKQISDVEYENQGISETEKALNELMFYMDSHPEEFGELLKKRKRQDLENGGVMSFLKVKVMDAIHGSNSPLLQVTTKEREKQLREMKHKMQKAFDYSLESKCRRMSKRLEEKRGKKVGADTTQNRKTKYVSKETSAIPAPPPPPPLLSAMPPPPPPPLMPTQTTNKYEVTPRRPFRPMQERLNGKCNTPNNVSMKEDANDSFGSIAPADLSLTSLHQELLSSNPWKRLKCVDENRSPGGTPSGAKKSLQMETPKGPLHMALMRKFQSIRSPSPGSHIVVGDVTSPSGFTPSP